MDWRYWLGYRDTKPLRIWLMIAGTIGLGANIVSLIGCTSAETRPLYLYRMSKERLITAFDDAGIANGTELDSGELPKTWYWGMSGVCAEFEDGTSTKCQQAFPPMFAGPDIISLFFKLRFDGDESSYDSPTNNTIAAWEVAYRELGERTNVGGRNYQDMAKASGALAIMSVIISVGILTMNMVSIKRQGNGSPPFWSLQLASVVDGALFLASGILALLVMVEGPRAGVDGFAGDEEYWGDFIGPSMYFILVGAVVKAAAVGVVFSVVTALGIFGSSNNRSCCGSRKRVQDPGKIGRKETGSSEDRV